MNMRNFTRAFLCVALLAFFPAPGEQPTQRVVTIPLEISAERETVRLTVEVADTEAAREYGLMYRRCLAPNAGMLFVNEADETVGFWMKNTYIPLDILYLDAGKRVVAIRTMEPAKDPEKGPWPGYDPGASYLYAVEVNKGFAEKHRIRVGDPVRFNTGPGKR